MSASHGLRRAEIPRKHAVFTNSKSMKLLGIVGHKDSSERKATIAEAKAAVMRSNAFFESSKSCELLAVDDSTRRIGMRSKDAQWRRVKVDCEDPERDLTTADVLEKACFIDLDVNDGSGSAGESAARAYRQLCWGMKSLQTKLSLDDPYVGALPRHVSRYLNRALEITYGWSPFVFPLPIFQSETCMFRDVIDTEKKLWRRVRMNIEGYEAKRDRRGKLTVTIIDADHESKHTVQHVRLVMSKDSAWSISLAIPPPAFATEDLDDDSSSSSLLPPVVAPPVSPSSAPPSPPPWLKKAISENPLSISSSTSSDQTMATSGSGMRFPSLYSMSSKIPEEPACISLVLKPHRDERKSVFAWFVDTCWMVDMDLCRFDMDTFDVFEVDDASGRRVLFDIREGRVDRNRCRVCVTFDKHEAANVKSVKFTADGKLRLDFEKVLKFDKDILIPPNMQDRVFQYFEQIRKRFGGTNAARASCGTTSIDLEHWRLHSAHMRSGEMNLQHLVLRQRKWASRPSVPLRWVADTRKKELIVQHAFVGALAHILHPFYWTRIPSSFVLVPHGDRRACRFERRVDGAGNTVLVLKSHPGLGLGARRANLDDATTQRERAKTCEILKHALDFAKSRRRKKSSMNYMTCKVELKHRFGHDAERAHKHLVKKVLALYDRNCDAAAHHILEAFEAVGTFGAVSSDKSSTIHAENMGNGMYRLYVLDKEDATPSSKSDSIMTRRRTIRYATGHNSDRSVEDNVLDIALFLDKESPVAAKLSTSQSEDGGKELGKSASTGQHLPPRAPPVRSVSSQLSLSESDRTSAFQMHPDGSLSPLLTDAIGRCINSSQRVVLGLLDPSSKHSSPNDDTNRFTRKGITMPVLAKFSKVQFMRRSALSDDIAYLYDKSFYGEFWGSESVLNGFLVEKQRDAVFDRWIQRDALNSAIVTERNRTLLVNEKSTLAMDWDVQYEESHNPIKRSRSSIAKVVSMTKIISANFEKSDHAYFLTVVVDRAENLPASDVNGSSDPYCELRAEDAKQTYRTSHVERELNPSWNASYRFGPFRKFADCKLERINVRVMDRDIFTSDDTLGSCTITLKGSSYAKSSSRKKNIVATLRNSVPVRTRHYHDSSYRSAFRGSDAVQSLKYHKFATTDDSAVSIAQELLSDEAFRRCDGAQKRGFEKKDSAFYRFNDRDVYDFEKRIPLKTPSSENTESFIVVRVGVLEVGVS